MKVNVDLPVLELRYINTIELLNRGFSKLEIVGNNLFV